MKGKGFDRLRITAVSAGAALASLFGAVTRSVRASTNLPLVYSSATQWQIRSSNCAAALGVPGHDCGIGVRQYTQPPTVPATTIVTPPTTPTVAPPPTTPTDTTSTGTWTTDPGTTGGGTSSPPTSNPGGSDSTAAFHDHGPVGKPPTKVNSKASVVNGAVAFNASLGLSVNSTVFKAPSGRVSLTSNRVTAGPQTIGGLVTSIQYQLDGASRSVRAIFTFHNTTSKTIIATMNTDLGGFGGNSAITLASSGVAATSTSNRWFETTGTTDANANPKGPPVIFVTYGSNARPMLRSISAASIAGATDYIASYNVNVAAGDTVGIMVFAMANASIVSKEAIDGVFANLRTLNSAQLLNNLPVPQEKLLNWNGPVRPNNFGVGKRP